MTDELSLTLGNINRLLEENGETSPERSETSTTSRATWRSCSIPRRATCRRPCATVTEFADMLGENAPRVDSIVGNLNDVTAQLSESGVRTELSDAVERFDGLLAKSTTARVRWAG